MTRYLVRRILQTIPVLFVISIIQFGLINAAPGGPIKQYSLDPNISAEDIARLEHELGLDQPLPIQYLRWMGNFLQGNLGYSYFSHRPVIEEVMGRLPVTIELSLAATLISYLIGIPLGVYAGLHRGGRIDHVIRFFTSLLNAVPHWWLGLLILIALANIRVATGIQLLPMGRAGTLGREGFDLLDSLWHLVLPALMLGTGGWVGFGRYMRSETLEVLGQDYVRTAQAKGLAPRVVVWRHVLRNALIPVVTISGGLLVGLLSGSVIYENIFSWPGMGRLLFDATLKKDYPISIGVAYVYTILAVFGRLIADLAYGWVDPRIRYD
ncbi:MAG: ABC transporter permease [Chloroflexi bacterium]|nr:ABC transporter permease [Chloroflexota bacterium]